MGSGDVPCHFLFGCKSVCPNTSARLPIYAEWAFPCSHAAEWASTAPHRSLPMACSEASRQASQVVNEVTFVAVHPTTGQGVVLVVQASIDACTTNTTPCPVVGCTATKVTSFTTWLAWRLASEHAMGRLRCGAVEAHSAAWEQGNAHSA